MMLGAALPCLMAIKNVGRVIKIERTRLRMALSCFNSLLSTAKAPRRLKKCWPKFLVCLTTPN